MFFSVTGGTTGQLSQRVATAPRLTFGDAPIRGAGPVRSQCQRREGINGADTACDRKTAQPAKILRWHGSYMRRSGVIGRSRTRRPAGLAEAARRSAARLARAR